MRIPQQQVPPLRSLLLAPVGMREVVCTVNQPLLIQKARLRDMRIPQQQVPPLRSLLLAPVGMREVVCTVNQPLLIQKARLRDMRIPQQQVPPLRSLLLAPVEMTEVGRRHHRTCPLIRRKASAGLTSLSLFFPGAPFSEGTTVASPSPGARKRLF